MVAQLVDVHGHWVEACSLYQATHFLAAVCPPGYTHCQPNESTSDTLLAPFGETFEGFGFTVADGVQLYYARLDTPIWPNMVALRAMVSDAMAGNDLRDVTNPTSLEAVARVWAAPKTTFENVSNVRLWLQSLVDGTIAYPKSHVTGFWHQHILQGEAAQMALSHVDCDRFRGLCTLAKKASDVTDAFIAGAITYLSLLSAELSKYVCQSDVWESDSIESWAKVTKNKTLSMKHLQGTVGVSLVPLFELEVLINRGVGNIDWEAERLHRTHPQVADFTYDQIYNAAYAEIMAGISENHFKFKNNTWDVWWASRWEHMPAGSFHSRYVDDRKHVFEDATYNTKFIQCLMMGYRTLRQFTIRAPMIEAHASEKYEWGKRRAIYGCDFTSFVLADFAFGNIEECLGQSCPLGEAAEASRVTARVDSIMSNRIAWCSDFEDFNSQHSLTSMRAVLDALYDVFSPVMSDEQREAAIWVRTAQMNQRVHVPITADEYNSKGTLLSGYRHTALINTLLNRVYLQLCGMAGSWLADTSLHNGDDGITGCREAASIIRIMAAAKEHQVRLQRTKCFFASSAEFLRVEHGGAGAGEQYLSRAIATLVHARAESGQPKSDIDLISATATRLNEVASRRPQQEVMEHVRQMQIGALARSLNKEMADIAKVMATHTVMGGVNTDQNALLDHKVSIINTTAENPIVGSVINSPGVYQYASFLHHSFNNLLSREHILRHVRQATARLLTRQRQDFSITKVKVSQVNRNRRSLSGALRNVFNMQMVGRARVAGVPIYRLASLARSGSAMRRLASMPDPLAYISLVA